MKKLLYLYILILFCGCDSEKQEKLEMEYLESFAFILEEQEILLHKESINLREKYLEMGNKNKAKNCVDFFSALRNEIEKDSISLGSFFTLGKEIDIQEQTHFFHNEDSLTAFFEIHKKPSPKQLLLSKLRLLRFGNDVIKKISQKHITKFPYNTSDQEFWETNPDFELLTTLNKSSFHHGDTLEMTMEFVPIQHKNISKELTIYLNDKKMVSDTFSIIATCEENKPCEKELIGKYHISDEYTRSFNTKYIVNPVK